MHKKSMYHIGLVTFCSCFIMACVSSEVITVRTDYLKKSLTSKWFKTSDAVDQGPSGVKLFNLAKALNPEVKTKLENFGKQPTFVKVCELGKRTFKYEFFMIFSEKREVWRINIETAKIEIVPLDTKLAEQSTLYCPDELISEYNRLTLETKRVAEETRIKQEQDLLEKRKKEENERIEQLRIANSIAKENEEKRLIKERREKIEKLQTDAKAGDRIAQFNYAEILTSEATSNETMIFQMYQKSAEQGYTEAQIKLGQCYLNGYFNIGVDLEKGVAILKRAAEGGDSKALNALGQGYLLIKDGCFLDSTNAIKCFVAAYEKDNSDAMCNLGYCYGNGIGVEKNENEAIEWFRRSAEKNNSKAQYILGRLQKDEACLRKSRTSEAALEVALNDYASFQRSRGIINIVGGNLPIESYDAVRSQFEKAARDGDMVSNRKCAQFIHKVRSYDIGDAIKYYTRAAEKGDVLSMANLHGCLLLKCINEELAKNRNKGDTLSGISDEKKVQIGMSFLRQTAPSSCDQRDPESVLKWVDRSMLKSSKFLYLLGRYQLDGSCIRRLSFEERDYNFYERQNDRDDSSLKEGLKFVREAAEAGEPEAMCYLASCYQTGSLSMIPQNMRDAVKWYQRAVDSGSELAKKELSTFEQQKRVFDKKVAFCDKTPDEKTAYINWRAAEMAKTTIVAKNVYIGMPIDEALFSFASLNFKCSTNDIIKFNKDDGKNVRTGSYYFDEKSKLTLFADENNCLRCFVLPPAVGKMLFHFTSPTVKTLSEDFSRLFDIEMKETDDSTPVIDIKNKDVLQFSGSQSKYYKSYLKNLQITIFSELVYQNGESKNGDSITARLLGNKFSDQFCIPSGSIVFRDDSSETSSH